MNEVNSGQCRADGLRSVATLRFTLESIENTECTQQTKRT